MSSVSETPGTTSGAVRPTLVAAMWLTAEVGLIAWIIKTALVLFWYFGLVVIGLAIVATIYLVRARTAWSRRATAQGRIVGAVIFVLIGLQFLPLIALPFVLAIMMGGFHI